MRPYIRERRRNILLALSTTRPRPSVRELSAMTGISNTTIDRDLWWLEQEGFIERSHGKSRAIHVLIPMLTGTIVKENADHV